MLWKPSVSWIDNTILHHVDLCICMLFCLCVRKIVRIMIHLNGEDWGGGGGSRLRRVIAYPPLTLSSDTTVLPIWTYIESDLYKHLISCVIWCHEVCIDTFTVHTPGKVSPSYMMRAVAFVLVVFCTAVLGNGRDVRQCKYTDASGKTYDLSPLVST